MHKYKSTELMPKLVEKYFLRQPPAGMNIYIHTDNIPSIYKHNFIHRTFEELIHDHYKTFQSYGYHEEKFENFMEINSDSISYVDLYAKQIREELMKPGDPYSIRQKDQKLQYMLMTVHNRVDELLNILSRQYD